MKQVSFERAVPWLSPSFSHEIFLEQLQGKANHGMMDESLSPPTGRDALLSIRHCTDLRPETDERDDGRSIPENVICGDEAVECFHGGTLQQGTVGMGSPASRGTSVVAHVLAG